MINELEYILKNTTVSNPISQHLGGCADAAGTVGDGQYFAIDLTSVNLGKKIYDIGGRNILEAAEIIYGDIITQKGYSLSQLEKQELYQSKAIEIAKKQVTIPGVAPAPAVTHKLSNYEDISQKYNEIQNSFVKFCEKQNTKISLTGINP